MTDSLPPPPDDKSLRQEFERRWTEVIEYWEQGYALEEELKALRRDLESERIAIFEQKTKEEGYDWESDWLDAKRYHDYHLNLIENRKVEIENLAHFWAKYFDNLQNVSSMVRTEAFRGLLLVNGAAMITAVAVLSGQVSNPSFYVKLAGKFILFCSGLSLLSMSFGYSMLHHLAEEVSAELRQYTIKPYKHDDVRTIGDKINGLVGIKAIMTSVFIYGAIVLFGLGMFAALSILVYFA